MLNSFQRNGGHARRTVPSPKREEVVSGWLRCARIGNSPSIVDRSIARAFASNFECSASRLRAQIVRSAVRNLWLRATTAPARVRAAAAARVVGAAALIAAATVVRTSAARGRTRPVSPATAVGLAGVIARRWSRLIRAASAVAATAAAAVRTTATVVRRAGAIARRWSRLIRAASAVAATAVVRRAGAVSRRGPRVIRAASAVAATAAVRWAGAIARRGPRVVRAASAVAAAAVRRAGAIARRGPRVIRAASAVTATGAAIGNCRSLTNDGRAYWKCARLRTGASHMFPEVAPAAAGLAAAVVGCRSELTSRRRPIRIHVLPHCGNVGPIGLGSAIVKLTESMPTTVVARASASRRWRRRLRAGWFADTAPTAAGLGTAAIDCRA